MFDPLMERNTPPPVFPAITEPTASDLAQELVDLIAQHVALCPVANDQDAPAMKLLNLAMTVRRRVLALENC